jgi:hypothetical protein
MLERRIQISHPDLNVAGSQHTLERIDPIKDSLGAAGFTDLRIAVLSLSKIIPDVPTYARALVLGNPLIDQIRARGGVDPERVIEELADALPRKFGTDPTRIPLQAIVFEAKRR